MKCTCGVENLPDAKFCAACGKKMEPVQIGQASGGAATAAIAQPAQARAAARPQPAAVRSPARKMGILPKIVLAILIVAAGAAYWWFNRPEPDYVAEQSGLFPVAEGNKWGYIDNTGAMQIQPVYDGASSFGEGLAPVLQQGKYGFIDTHGQMVIQPQFDAVRPFVHGLAAVKICCGPSTTNNDQWGFIGKDGKYVINPQFQAVWDFTSSLAPVKVNGSWGLVDKQGNIAVKPAFASMYDFSEGLATVSDGGRWGFIGKDGTFVIKPQFESAGMFRENLALVRMGGKVGYIDHSGKMVINPQFETGMNFHHGFTAVTIGGKSATIDKNGKFLMNPGQILLSREEIGDDILPGRNGNGWGYVDRNGTWVIQPSKSLDYAGRMSGGVASVSVAGESGMIDRNGTIIWGAYKGQSLSNIAKTQEFENAALASLRTIITAQVSYSTSYPDAGYANQLTKLGTMPEGGQANSTAASLISAGLAQGDDAGYHFALSAPAEGGITSRYTVTATPASGQGRTFCTNQLGIIRVVKAGETCDPDASPVFNR
ncbi:MAG TPA: WG repeat-containing protein [Candidatus Angelobacter sp.]|nr:WG repeat-containing protein [Candidatus Angelobacter sp.]